MRYRDRIIGVVALIICIVVALPAFAQEEAKKKEAKPAAKAKAERTVKSPKAKEDRVKEAARQGAKPTGERGAAGQRGGGGRGPLPPNIKERFGSDDMSDLVEVVKVWRMGRELGLTEEQTLKLLRANDEHRKKTAQLRQQQTKLITELRRSVHGNKEDKKQLQALLKKIAALDEQRLRSELDRQKKLLSDMTPQQKAKYYLFRKRFDQDVRGIIGGIMRRRRGGEGGEFSGRPGEGPPGQFRGGQDRPGQPRGGERGEFSGRPGEGPPGQFRGGQGRPGPQRGGERRERDRNVPRRDTNPQ